jgi:hypothetical protein
MSGLPQELIFVIVVVVMLVQFMLKQWRKNVDPAPRKRGPDADEAAAAAAAELQYQTQPQPQPQPPVMPEQQRPEAAVPRLLVNLPPLRGPVQPRAQPRSARTATKAQPSRQAPSRYSRAALMPNRRAVRQAFVINAILQPCHAHRSPDTE